MLISLAQRPCAEGLGELTNLRKPHQLASVSQRNPCCKNRLVKAAAGGICGGALLTAGQKTSGA